jgi:TP901 family phage tail tape measure protein
MIMGKTPLGNMVIELGLDATNFNKTLTTAKNGIKAFSAEMKTNVNAANLMGNEQDALIAKVNGLSKMVQVQNTVLEKTREKFKSSADATGQFTNAQSKGSSEIAKAKTQLANYSAQLEKASKDLLRYKLENEGATSALLKFGSNAQTAGDKIHKAGESMRNVSTGLAAVFIKSAQYAMDFNQQMTTMRALLDNGKVSAKQLDSIIENLGEHSKEWATQYGISTTEINNGMTELIKKGYDANQTIAAMPAILDATKASGEDFNTVMNASSSILQQFNLKAKDTSRVTDALTFVANETAAGFGDMGNALEYVGPVASSLGMELEETAAAVGLLSNNGIAGEKAGTALRGALTRLLKPSKTNAEAMKELGFSSREFKDGALDLPGVIDRIKTSTQGMTSAQKTALIAQAFGTEAQTGMNILVNQGSEALRGLTKETQNAAGYTAKLAKQMNSSDANAINRLKESVKVLAVTIGQELAPMAADFADKLTAMIKWFGKLDDGTKKTIVSLGLIGAASSPALLIFGNLAKGVGSATTALTKFYINQKVASSGSVALAKAIGANGVGDALASVAKGAGTASASIAGVGTASAGSVSGIGSLATSMGLLSPGAVAVAGVVLGALAMKEGYDQYQLAVGRWGTAVSAEQDKQLQKTQQFVSDAKVALSDYQTGWETASETVKQSVSKLDEHIKTSAETANKALEKLYKDLPSWAKKAGREEIDDQQNTNNEIVKKTSARASEVQAIMKNASEQKRQLTALENSKILALIDEMSNSELDLLGFNADQQKSIRKSMSTNVKELTENELRERFQQLQMFNSKEIESYEKQKAAIKRVFKGAEQEEMLAKLDQQHQASMLATQNILEQIGQTGGKAAELANQYLTLLEQTGYDVNKVTKKSTDATKEQQKEWSSLLKEMGKSWDDVKLDPKTGKITTEGRQELLLATMDTMKWNDLTVKEKDLLVNGDEAQKSFLDSVDKAQDWNRYEILAKELGVDNWRAIQNILNTQDAFAHWNGLKAEDKELLVKNGKSLEVITQSTASIDRYNQLVPEQKELLINNDKFMAKVLESDENLARWNALPVSVKQFLATNEQLFLTVMSSEETLNRYNSLSIPDKEFLGQNQDILAKVLSSEESLAGWNNMPVADKQLIMQNAQAIANMAAGRGGIDMWNQKQAIEKWLQAQDQASPVIQWVQSQMNGLNDKLITIRVNAQVQQAKKELRAAGIDVGGGGAMYAGANYAQGTSYHPGGLAMINDQSGATYKELVSLPNGTNFIAEGRDVIMPLPRGTKVLRAALTKRLIPNYAEGIGIPENASIFSDMRSVTQRISTTRVTNIDQNVGVDNERLDRMIALLMTIAGKRMAVELDGEKVSRSIESSISKIQQRNERIRGRIGGEYV